MVGDLPFQDRHHVFRDGPLATMGVDDDPFEQVVGDVDGPSLDPFGGSGLGGSRFLRCRPPALCRGGFFARSVNVVGVGLVRRRLSFENPGQSSPGPCLSLGRHDGQSPQ